MGFDLSGIKPTSEEGHYFRANVWYWRPIWGFVRQQLPDLLSDLSVVEVENITFETNSSFA